MGGVLSWLWLGWGLVVLLVAFIFIRITVPRLKMETLPRLGWGSMLALVLSIFLVYGLGFILG